jgi:hypothetical protein
MNQHAHANRKTMVPTQPQAPPAASPPGLLLTPEQLAEKLNVPAGWIRERVRTRARVRDSDPLPCIRLGKYTRFRWSDIEAWLVRQSEGKR